MARSNSPRGRQRPGQRLASTCLDSAQAADALAALERLRAFYQSTGKRSSLLSAVSEYCEAAGKLNGTALNEAVNGYLGTVASVKRKDIAEVVEDFLKGEDPRTKAKDGERAQLSGHYLYTLGLRLRRLAVHSRTPRFQIGPKTTLTISSAQSRSANSRPRLGTTFVKAARLLLAWAVRKDYLSAAHRLREADSMRFEHANTADVQFYTPHELRALLEAADSLRPLVAIAGLAGLRANEHLTAKEMGNSPSMVHSHYRALSTKAEAQAWFDTAPAKAEN